MPEAVDFYTREAKRYFLSTHTVDMTPLRARFLHLVGPKGRLLDAGCGSGRDAKAFLAQGYEVEAFDASAEMARLASTHTGIAVRASSFLNLEEVHRFDGIWACASLLHVSPSQQPEALARLHRALKPGGVLYASYKLGNGERTDAQGRHFTDADQDRLSQWIQDLKDAELVDTWITGDARPGHSEQWLNALICKA